MMEFSPRRILDLAAAPAGIRESMAAWREMAKWSP